MTLSVVQALITDLLSELNERELEIPFRSLLRSLGYSTTFERTRHGPGEHGKDIIACSDIDGVPTVLVYQLKTREVNLRRFRNEVKPELEAMIEVPIVHPLVSGTESFSYHLVSTGDLSPDASVELKGFNERNRRIGEPEVRLINRAILTKMFYDDMTALSIFTPAFQDRLARLWLDIKSNEYDRTDWFALFDQILDKSQEALILLALCTAFIASQAFSQGNFLVSCDIFRIALVKMWGHILQLNRNEMGLFDQLHEEYCGLIELYIHRNEENLRKDAGLYDESKGTVESILYPIRSWSLLGIMSYLAYYKGIIGEDDKENELADLIENVIAKNPSVITPILDSLRKDIAITVRELVKNQKKKIAEELVKRLLDNLYQRFTLSGWWPSMSQNAEEIVEDTFQFKEKREEQPASFLIPILFRFCAKLGLRATYDRFRPLFDDFVLREFSPPDDVALAESMLIHGVLDLGTTVDNDFPDDFAEYCEQTSRIEAKRYITIAKNRKYILQLISDAHSHYVFPERHLDF